MTSTQDTMRGLLWHNRARVTRVVDGDTMEVTVDLGRGIQIMESWRLIGVNTPETNRAASKVAGLEAKAFVVRWLEEAWLGAPEDMMEWPLLVRTWLDRDGAETKRDSFRRILAEVSRFSDGETLNQALVEAGHAEVDIRTEAIKRTT